MARRRMLHPLLLALVLGAAACSGKVRSEFVAGCVSGGAPKAACKCTFDKLEDRYGSSTLNRMQESGVVPPGMGEAVLEAVAQCSADFQGGF